MQEIPVTGALDSKEIELKVTARFERDNRLLNMCV